MTGSTGATGATGGKSGSTGSTGKGGSGGSTQAQHDARVAVDQAAVEAATTSVTSAEDAVTGATLKAPIDGVISALPYTKGAVEGTSQSASILGTGAVQVTVDVPLATAQKLKSGMAATVTPDGSSTASDGTISSIGILPASSGNTPTYPVVIMVPDPGSGLIQGATANVTITLASVSGVLTLPNSALIPTGTNGTSTVTLVQNGQLTKATVKTGAVGATSTQILSGVTTGQVVEIADPSQAVPASSVTANQLSRGGGGAGGGGGFGGGAGGTRTGGGATSSKRGG
jgi:HlyD family secretion protein